MLVERERCSGRRPTDDDECRELLRNTDDFSIVIYAHTQTLTLLGLVTRDVHCPTLSITVESNTKNSYCSTVITYNAYCGTLVCISIRDKRLQTASTVQYTRLIFISSLTNAYRWTEGRTHVDPLLVPNCVQ